MKRIGSMAVAVAMVAALLAPAAFGAALAAPRDTPQRAGDAISLGVYTGTTIYAGALVAVNSSGYAVNGSDAASIHAVGCAAATVVNTGASGAKTIKILQGVFRYGNGDTVSDANIGATAYIVDNATVSATNTGSNAAIAGTVVDVDDDGVWVLIRHLDRTAGSFTTLAASGGSTLAAVTASGAAALNGGITADSSKFKVADTTGDTYVDGTFTAKGAVVCSNTVAVTGAATLTGGAISPTVAISAAKVGVYTNSALAGWFQQSGTALQYVTIGYVTNAVDADVTSP